jgi:endonuclease YncB( thermonuclease family)
VTGHPASGHRLPGSGVFRVLAALALCLAARAQASPLAGRVVHVADGDTITVLDPSNTSFRVRLAGIDAPEKAQPWGKVSKQAMADLVAGKEVIVEWRKRDRYHRLVGVVRVDGADAGLAQITEGLAWHYLDYEKEQTPEDRLLYASAEQNARAQKMGLWRDPDPVPPWVWRRRKRRPGVSGR